MDDRKTARLAVDNRPSFTQGRDKFVYPNLLRLTEGSSPDLKHKSHTITADVVVPDGGADGVLFTQRGEFCGYGFYVKDGKLMYHYNLAGVDRYTVVSDEKIPTGKVQLKMQYVTDADKPFAGANVTLYANDQVVGKGRVEKSIPNRVTPDETTDIGFDTGTPINDTYNVPFKFGGRLKAVTIELQ
ncbi:hypothetical protein [Bremerella alba]|uniref:hypothetical protein n=1 Tax=Bremerella alba TaxID=980252 RepID=UPI001A955CD3|nr:hypothetical protein [Bremerella alba]